MRRRINVFHGHGEFPSKTRDREKERGGGQKEEESKIKKGEGGIGMMEDREKETGNGKKKEEKEGRDSLSRLGDTVEWWEEAGVVATEKRFDGFESELGSSEAPTHEEFVNELIKNEKERGDSK